MVGTRSDADAYEGNFVKSKAFEHFMIASLLQSAYAGTIIHTRFSLTR